MTKSYKKIKNNVVCFAFISAALIGITGCELDSYSQLTENIIAAEVPNNWITLFSDLYEINWPANLGQSQWNLNVFNSSFNFEDKTGGGASATNKYWTLRGTGAESWAAGGWQGTVGTNVQDLSGYKLVFYAKSSDGSNTTFKFGAEDGTTNAEFATNYIAGVKEWTKFSYGVPDFTFGNSGTAVNISAVSVIKFVLANGTSRIDIDEIYLVPDSSTAPTSAPDSTPPAGTTPIVIYGNGAITGVNMNPNWGQATAYTTETIAGNTVSKYSNINFQGIDFSGNPQNISGKSHFHMDVWTPNTADGLAANRFYIIAGGEYAVDMNMGAGEWTSIDIPLSVFAAAPPPPNGVALDLTNLTQLKFDPNNLDPSLVGKTIYIDNIYFW